jgi:hypothetical protein
MPRFDVHIYAIARVKVASVNADSPIDAIRTAEAAVDLHQAIASGDAAYADEIEGFLVDRLDDSEERMEGQSVFFDAKEHDRTMKHSPILLKLAQMGRSCLRFLFAVGRKLKPHGRGISEDGHERTS